MNSKQLYWAWQDPPTPTSLENVLNCVGEGWHPLVTKLIDALFSAGWSGKLHQVKEKFGGLRFYATEGTPECWELIDLAEKESETTCEVCGKPGTINASPSWLRCLCEEHK